MFQIGNMNRNEKIRTYNFSRNTIVDHRLGKTKQMTSLDLFLEGSLGFEVLEMFKKKLQKIEDHECLQELLEK
jgi:peptide chain release factor 1